MCTPFGPVPPNSQQFVALLKPAKDFDEVGDGVKRRWYLSYTTRNEYLSKRNLQLDINSPTSQGTELTLSWQSLTSTVVEKANSIVPSNCEIEGRAIWRPLQWVGKEECHDQSKVLAMGKEGALMDGLIETEWGIEDEAGELRADWRSRYLVLLTTSIGHPPILDLYLSRPHHAAEETLRQLTLELTTSPDSDLQNLANSLFRVTMDSGRDAEEKAERERQRAKWETRSGEEAGIWRADDEDESKESMCHVM